MNNINFINFLNKSKEKYNNFYDYSKVVYVNSKTKVIITCPIHGDFLKSPEKHLYGQGCKECVKKYLSNMFCLSNEEFINKAISIHGNKYNYDLVSYKKNTEKITIICKKHGDFNQTPANHLKGQGCPLCKNEYISKIKRYNFKKFLQMARKVHGDKYSYDKKYYTLLSSKTLISCSIHGGFYQSGSKHISGQGCPKCNGTRNFYLEDFIEKAIATHGSKYTYLNSVYVNAKTKIIITCLKHGNFYQTPSDHLSGYGCSKCACSKGENALIQIFDKNNINYIHQYTIPNFNQRYRYDFYLSDYNLLIEFHGIQHFKPIDYFGGTEGFKNIKERDLFKKELANLAKIKLIEFNYLDLNLGLSVFEINVLKKLFDYQQTIKGK